MEDSAIFIESPVRLVPSVRLIVTSSSCSTDFVVIAICLCISLFAWIIPKNNYFESVRWWDITWNTSTLRTVRILTMVNLTYAFWKNSYNFRGREGGGTSMMLLIFLAIKKYIPYSLVIGKGYISYLKLN